MESATLSTMISTAPSAPQQPAGVSLDALSQPDSATQEHSQITDGLPLDVVDTHPSKRKIDSHMAARLQFLLATLGKLRLKTDLARYVDVTTMTISRWVNDKAVPSIEQVQQIANFVEARFDLGEAKPGDVLAWLQEDSRDAIAATLKTMTPKTNAIRDLRTHLGLTAEVAASRLGISRQALYTWEYDPKVPADRLERCRAAWRDR